MTTTAKKRIMRKPGQVWRVVRSDYPLEAGELIQLVREDGYGWDSRPRWRATSLRTGEEHRISSRAFSPSEKRFIFIGDSSSGEERPWTVICGNCGSGRVVVATVPPTGACPYCHG